MTFNPLMTIGTCLRMEFLPCREINSSVSCAIGSSFTTRFELSGSTVVPLLELIQTNRPYRQYEQDTDCESRQNGPNPICMRNHGVPASMVVTAGYCRPGITALAPTVIAIPDVNLTAREEPVDGVACVPCAFW